jgi:hypothetical protein
MLVMPSFSPSLLLHFLPSCINDEGREAGRKDKWKEGRNDPVLGVAL